MPTITLLGHCPTKKNAYMRSRNGRMYRRADIAAAIDALTLQAQSQWRCEPLAEATVRAKFYVRDGRGDLDGKLTTVLDILVKAGVIRNDSIARLKDIRASVAAIRPDEAVEVQVW